MTNEVGDVSTCHSPPRHRGMPRMIQLEPTTPLCSWVRITERDAALSHSVSGGIGSVAGVQAEVEVAVYKPVLSTAARQMVLCTVVDTQANPSHQSTNRISTNTWFNRSVAGRAATKLHVSPSILGSD